MTKKESRPIVVGSTNRRVSEWCNPSKAPPREDVGSPIFRGPSAFGSLTIGAGNIMITESKIMTDRSRWEKWLNHI